MVKGARRTSRGLWSHVLWFVSRIGTQGKQYYTIMFIPHSEQKIINFKISVFGLNVLILLAITVFGGLAYYAANFSSLSRQSDLKGTQMELAQINLDLVREEAAQLRIVAQDFETVMASTMDVVGVSLSLTPQVAPEKGNSAALNELVEFQTLRLLLQKSEQPLEQIGDVLSSQKSLLVEIPSLWPLKEVRGWVTNPFGPAIHPFTGQWYLHKGIDIAQRLGTPIVASANGKVSRIDFEALGYGHYVDIKHNYGFLTKYGHLQRSYVTKGQEILRGQVVGTLGSSGLSTGPHLHYEVRIGNQVVDPTKYLSFSSSLLTE